MKRVLVLDACQRSALAVTRSLGRHNVPVMTADESASALAGNSRYSRKYVTYPSPQQHPDRFISAIAALCKTEDINIIFPMTELTADLLLKHHSQLPDITLPFPAISTVDALSDKVALMKLAESLDIPIPGTQYIEQNERPVIPENQQYPLVLKPGKSWLEHDGKWFRASVRIADHAEQAADILAKDPAFHSHSFLLQECVPGNGEGIFALYNNGKPVAFFAHKRLREKPPRGGVSVLSESAVTDSSLLSHARTLLDHNHWHGIAMVEFRVTKEGTPYLMEVNTRFWGSLQLAVDAGVDFPWLLYQVTCHEPVQTVTSYKTGIRLRWILGDLDTLYLVLRDNDFSALDKIKAILQFLLPHPFITRHEVNRIGDLRPFWWELKQYVRDLLGKA
jgi:predicted ATP-grasp superfamily ATP-dependent carboligase